MGSEIMDDAALYNLIVGISKDVGEIKSDVKNVQQNVENNANQFMKSDEKLASKLEEYFDYAKNRQDKIKVELENKIGTVKIELTDFITKLNKTQMEYDAGVEERLSKHDALFKNFEDELKNIKEFPKNKTWELVLKFKNALIVAIISIIVGVVISQVRIAFKAIKSMQDQQTVKKLDR